MTLEQALYILARIHTRDDDFAGFVIVSGVRHGEVLHSCSASEYIEAWRVVRDAVHLPTAPESTTTEKI